MGRRSFIRRVVLPAAYVLGVMMISINVYDLSRHIESRLLHHFVIGCPLVALLCMGLSEIWCRIIVRRKSDDKSVKVFSLSNSALLIISFIAICLMLWNGGHSYFLSIRKYKDVLILQF